MSEEFVTREELTQAVEQEVNKVMDIQPEAVEEQTKTVTIGDREYPADDRGNPIVPDNEFWSVTEIRNAWYPGFENSRGGKLPQLFGWIKRSGLQMMVFSALGDPDDRDAEHSPSIRGFMNADYEKLREFKVRTERERAERLEAERANVIAAIKEQKRKMAESREAHRKASLACIQAVADAENVRKRAYVAAQKDFDMTYAANNAEADRREEEAREAAIAKNEAAQQEFVEAQQRIAETHREAVEKANAEERTVIDANPLYF